MHHAYLSQEDLEQMSSVEAALDEESNPNMAW